MKDTQEIVSNEKDGRKIVGLERTISINSLIDRFYNRFITFEPASFDDEEEFKHLMLNMLEEYEVIAKKMPDITFRYEQ